MVRRRRRRRDDLASPTSSLASLAVYAALLSFSISPTVAAAAAAVAHAPRRQKLQPLDETPSGGGGIGGKGWHTARNSWIDVSERELEGEERNARFINGDGDGACSANGGGNGKGVGSNSKLWEGQAWGAPAPALEPSCHLLDRPSDAYSGAVKTIGGTMPDILQDSSWCAGDEVCVLPRATGAGNKEVARGGVGGRQKGTGSCIAAAGAATGGNGGEAEVCRGEFSISGDTGRVPDDEARAWPSGEAPPGRDGRFTTTAAASLADFSAAKPKEKESRPPSTTEQSGLPTAARPTVATERPPQQEQRGPLVKGQGANTNTRDRDDAGGVEHPGATAVGHGDRRTGTPEEDARAEEPTPGRWSRPANVGPAGGGSKGKGRRERELRAGSGGGGSGDDKRGGEGGVLETAFVGGKAWPSWRALACILLLSALVLGTYVRGSMPHWLPFFGGDRRQRWAIDLDSAIAHARSRAGSFCSGRASVFSGDPVDDSDVPDLISDNEEKGEDGNKDQGVVSGDGEEAPLMWDKRPKPDDYLVFHPVLGVVPAGVVRAWGGDGCGGWGGVRAEAAAAGVRVGGANGGPSGKGCGCSSKSSPRGARAPAAVSSKAMAVGGAVKGKQLPPDEWPEWLAARKATAAAAVAEVEAGKEAAATIRPPPPAAVPTEDAIAAVPAVVEGGEANDGREMHRGGDGERTATATEARPAAASAGKAVVVGVGRTIDPQQQQQQQQPLGNASRTRPAAIGLQFEDGCVNGGGGDSSTEGPRPLDGEEGDALGFVGGAGGGGSVGSCCSSEDNSSIDVRAGDFSTRRVSLSSEQPPAMTAAYHVS